MIKLIFDDLEISVKPDNPIYKTLKKFEGETFTVKFSGGGDEETPVPSPIPHVKTFTVEAEPYYNLLTEAFDEDFLKTNTGIILRSHLDNIFQSGIEELVKVGVDKDQNVIFATKDKRFALVNL